MRTVLMLPFLSIVAASAAAAPIAVGDVPLTRGTLCVRQVEMSMTMTMSYASTEAGDGGEDLTDLVASMGAPTEMVMGQQRDQLVRVLRPAVPDKRPGRYEVLFRRLRDQGAEGDQTSPLEGRTFDVDRASGRVREHGEGPVDDELAATVLAALDDPAEACGSEDLAGMTLVRGQDVPLPLHLSTDDDLSFDARVAGVRRQAGRRVARLVVEGRGRLEPTEGLAVSLTVDGDVRLDVETGRLISADLTGSLSLDASGIPGMPVQISASGPMVFSGRSARYTKKGRLLYDTTRPSARADTDTP